MERMLPDAANPNAFSDALVRLTKDYADANPGDVARLHGGDVRPVRYEWSDEKTVMIGLTFRRHLGTKHGPGTGQIGGESCRGLCSHLNGVINRSAWWQAGRLVICSRTTRARSGNNSAENGRISQVTCSDQRI